MVQWKFLILGLSSPPLPFSLSPLFSRANCANIAHPGRDGNFTGKFHFNVNLNLKLNLKVMKTAFQVQLEVTASATQWNLVDQLRLTLVLGFQAKILGALVPHRHASSGDGM